MTRILYNTTSGQLLPWNRADDSDPVGLAPNLEIFQVDQAPEPNYDPTTHYLEQLQEIDVEAKLVTRGWEVVEIPPLPERDPEPQWIAFGKALALDPAVVDLVKQLELVNPILRDMVSGGLMQAAQGDSRTFIDAWTTCLELELISMQLASKVKIIGEVHYLPEEFLLALLPQ